MAVLKQTSPTAWPVAPKPIPSSTVPSASTSNAVGAGSSHSWAGFEASVCGCVGIGKGLNVPRSRLPLAGAIARGHSRVARRYQQRDERGDEGRPGAARLDAPHGQCRGSPARDKRCRAPKTQRRRDPRRHGQDDQAAPGIARYLRESRPRRARRPGARGDRHHLRLPAQAHVGLGGRLSDFLADQGARSRHAQGHGPHHDGAQGAIRRADGFLQGQRACEEAARRRLTAMTQRRMLVGLLGANIQGSMSPALFADAFAAAGIDGYYHLLDADRLPGRLPQLFDAIKTAGFIGANVTFPFKQEIIPLLDAVDPGAAQVGAVNTVMFAPDGRSTGYNFDRAGWRNSFNESIGSASAKDATVVQIGAGGAGRAVAFALMDLGVANLVLHDLDTARANALKADLARHYGSSRCRLAQDLERDIVAAAGVVNATQVGMRGFPGNPVPVAALKATHWAADVIYTPMQTEFLKAAAAKGARTLNGSGMCVHQAVEAFAQLTGVTPDLARLHRTFATAVAARDAALAAAT